MSTRNFKPIVAFEVLLSGKPGVYHTDGIELVGPKLVTPRKGMTNDFYVVISYLSLIFKPSKFDLWQEATSDIFFGDLWYREIYTVYFANAATFLLVLREITEGYSSIYKWLDENQPIEKVNPLTPHYGWFIPEYPTIEALNEHLATKE
jgi:hypothetical protein